MKAVLIDKENFSRFKACGGAVSEQALSYLDFSVPESLIEQCIFGARMHFQDQIFECKKDYRIAVLIQGKHFDHHLLIQAKESDAEFITGLKVRNFHSHDNHVELMFS